MTKTELESKRLAELHDLAADAGVERYRMLTRAELIEKLADGGAGGESAGGSKAQGRRRGESGRGRQRDRKPRERREPRGERERREERKPKAPREEKKPKASREEKKEAEDEAPREERAPEPSIAPASTPSPRPKRKRRRRWGRRRKEVQVHDLLLPPSGRQAIVYAETRASCTALLREVAAQLSDASDGPDPVAVLVDPTPEELADWKREAPAAEIVSAGKAKHAGDAIAQAQSRAAGGEDVIVLVDSLTRFAESFGDAEEARDLFDAAGAAPSGGGSLTVVAAVERAA